MAKILTVYEKSPKEHDVLHGDLVPVTMAYIRWFKISEELTRLGHEVDMATTDYVKNWSKSSENLNGTKVRRIPLSEVKWDEYDVIKTLFHRGFETLEAYGGADHPFIISKLGSVVGPCEMEGIYFYGKMREQLYSTQQRIDQTSKYIVTLSTPAKQLWESCFGPGQHLLIVPGAVDRHVPLPSQDPYPTKEKKRILFAGNIYTKDKQPEANEVLAGKLNRLGKLLLNYNAQLYMIGSGDLGQLDKKCVTYLGAIPYNKAWNHFYFADVGIVVAPGRFHHNNESSKIYHYLRVGLPVVSESGFPNDYVVTESGLGFVVESGNLELMAQKVEEAARKDWNRDHAIKYILDSHTWDKRVEVYDRILREEIHKR